MPLERIYGHRAKGALVADVRIFLSVLADFMEVEPLFGWEPLATLWAGKASSPVKNPFLYCLFGFDLETRVVEEVEPWIGE